MPVPLFTFLIPGIALFFLMQMILCRAFHFKVQLSRSKNNNRPKELKMSSKENSNLQGNDGKGDPKVKKQENLVLGNRNDNKPDTQSSSSLYSSSNESIKAPTNNSRRRSEDCSRTSSKCEGRKVAFNFPGAPTADEPQDPDDSQVYQRDDKPRKRRQSVFAESYDPSKDNDDSKVVHEKSPEEKIWLEEHLTDVTLFQHLAHDQITTVADAMHKQPVEKGEQITKEGDKGTFFYVIQKGVFAVYVKNEDGEEQLVKTYDNEGSFGELALLYNQPRAASVVAQSDGVLWAVDGQTFRRIVYKITHQKRVMYENLINNVPMMKELEPYERANLVDALSPMTFEDGQEIVQQGAEADGMYFIISGKVKVVLFDSNGDPHLLNELSNSDYFGELGLLTNKPRVASAFAVGTTQLAFLCRNAFERLLGPCMDVMNRNINRYNEKLHAILQALEES